MDSRLDLGMSKAIEQRGWERRGVGRRETEGEHS